MKNIYAYTEPKLDYPAAVSIDDTPTGNFMLRVRSRWNGAEGIGVIELTPAQLEALAFDTLKALGYNI